MEGTTSTFTTLLDAISEIFTAILGHIGTVGETIVNTPILLLSVVLGIAVSLIFTAKRFMTRR